MKQVFFFIFVRYRSLFCDRLVVALIDNYFYVWYAALAILGIFVKYFVTFIVPCLGN